MSLILEALRKSEAERRRGQVPGLHADPAPGGALSMREGPPAWLWLALALATAMVLAIALWLARNVLSVPPGPVDVPVAAIGPAPVVSADISGTAGPDDQPISTVGPSAMPDERAGAGPIAVVAPASGREAGPVQVPDAVSAAPTPSMPPVRAPATTEAAVASADAAPSAPARAPAPAIPVPEPVVATTPAAVAATAAMPAAATSTSKAAPLAPPVPGSAPLRLSDLTVTQRRQLPPLKMSMHMWAPTQRFAIIDGARVSEGDRVGDAVVEEITANGVVLAWQGQRLHIPTR